VSELMGSDSFGTAPNEAMSFPGGKIGGRAILKEDCGCSPAIAPVLRAEGQAPPLHDHTDGNAAPPAVVPRNVTTPLPPSSTAENHTVVSTPFVYSAESDRPAEVARLQFSSLPNAFFAQDEPTLVVLSERPADVSAAETKKEPASSPRETEQPKKEEKGFLARMKGFFRSLFHR
jgi:hypothetical protein